MRGFGRRYATDLATSRCPVMQRGWARFLGSKADRVTRGGDYDAFRDARSMAWCKSRIQNCGEVLSNCASRRAVSALMPRLPRMISFRRFRETPRRRAASAWPTPSGFRNSSSRISPGGIAGPSQLESLVIILDADFVGMSLLPTERYAKLVVDSNATAS